MTLEKAIQERVGVKADGIIGPLTLAAIGRALGCGEGVRAIQERVGVKVDGIFGILSKQAVAQALGVKVPPTWPTQAEVRAGGSVFGRYGAAGNELVLLDLPYPFYYEGKQLTRISCHRVIAPVVREILEEVLEAYGAERIHDLGLDDYGGCYNDRNTTGGSTKSMHAWGIAFDFAPGRNALKMDRTKASLARPECERWWEIWERHGAVSLGRARNYDWMHVQFARL